MSRFADEVQMRRCAGVVQCFKIRTGSYRGIGIVEVCWKAGVVKR